MTTIDKSVIFRLQWRSGKLHTRELRDVTDIGLMFGESLTTEHTRLDLDHTPARIYVTADLPGAARELWCALNDSVLADYDSRAREVETRLAAGDTAEQIVNSW